MYFSTLSEWLAWIATIHITEIELGLDRVKKVAAKLQVLSPSCPVIIVGGTNGKGSTVAGLEAIYRAAEYRVGAFTSPFLFKYNEEVSINGVLASDEEFCRAFEKIEASRADISLTPFEFCTLAALLIFKEYPLDVLILEVGLGGRLDAVNIIDADVAIVASIGIDHVEWLGATRELIAGEKAGIFRTGKPAVCGDEDPPASLLNGAVRLGTPIFCQGRDFHYQAGETDWSWSYGDHHYAHLPNNSLAIQNMSTVLMAITLLNQRLPVTRAALHQGLSTVTLMGRIQVIEGPITEIYDVAHNPAAVALLSDRLQEIARGRKIYAVFSMLADKDISASIRVIRDVITAWYSAPLPVKRAATTDQLAQAFYQADIKDSLFFSSLEEAYKTATTQAVNGDCIAIFGSFHTVAAVLKIKR